MKLFLSFVFCLSVFATHAQRYTSAIGLRVGTPDVTYINAKYRMNQQAIELGIGGNFGAIWVHGNAYQQNELNDILDLYYGFGANVGVGQMKQFGTDYSGLGLGVNAVVGLEHTFEDFPFNISLDAGPGLYVLPNLKFGFAAALSVRYVLH